MSEWAKQVIAPVHAAQLGRRHTAARHDHLFGMNGAKRRTQHKAVFLRRYAFHPAAAHLRRAQTHQFQPQQIQHGGRLSAGGINAAFLFLSPDQPQRFKERQRIVHIHAAEHPAHGAGVIRVIIRRTGGPVGEIAPTVAGGKQFSAAARLRVKYRQLCSVGQCPSRCHCCRQTRRSAADHRDIQIICVCMYRSQCFLLHHCYPLFTIRKS